MGRVYGRVSGLHLRTESYPDFLAKAGAVVSILSLYPYVDCG
jgi:hypothetical protein